MPHYKGAAKLGHGIDYDYPHDHPQDWVAQQYLPDRIKNAQYYQPKKTMVVLKPVWADNIWQLRKAQQHILRGKHHPSK